MDEFRLTPMQERWLSKPLQHVHEVPQLSLEDSNSSRSSRLNLAGY